MNSIRNAWWTWFSLLLALAGGLGAAAKPAGSPVPADLSRFKVIASRNIFNSNRTSRTARTAAAKPPKIESFALTGTLSYEKGTFAFFDGTSAAYRKVLQPEGTIAGYKVTEITPEAAKLEANGRQIELRVGGQLRRADKGAWEVAANPIAYASSSKRKSPAPARSSQSSKAKAGHKRPSKHGAPAGVDKSQFSKGEVKALLKAEKEVYSKEEMNSFTKEEMQGYSKDDAKDVKEVLKQLMQQREEEMK